MTLNMDRNSPIPLYYQLKQILLDKILKGEWKPGELIPSENQLQEDFSVSRTTVRQTLSELVTEGYLNRQRGRGTFIAEPKITYDPSKQLELNEFMLAQGVRLGWRVQDREWIKASERIADLLRCGEGSRVLRIRRLRLADSRPIGYHIAYLPESIAQFIEEASLDHGQSLDYLMRYPGMAQPRLQRTLEATIANDLDADWLESAPGTPILQLERLTLSKEGTPVEFLLARFRGDRFKFQITS
jgi:GntR family transcriptional regulator